MSNQDDILKEILKETKETNKFLSDIKRNFEGGGDIWTKYGIFIAILTLAVYILGREYRYPLMAIFSGIFIYFIWTDWDKIRTKIKKENWKLMLTSAIIGVLILGGIVWLMVMVLE